jgi:type IV pilus assembly protein PilW
MLNQAHGGCGHRRQRGVTLVELMIGMVVGIIAMLGILSVYIAVVAGNSDVVQAARLNQEIRVALDFIANDVHRAGYRSDPRDHSTDERLPVNCFMNRNTGVAGCPGVAPVLGVAPGTGVAGVPSVGDLFILDDDGTCLLLSYQATWPGASQQVVFGYRLANGTLQMLQDPTGSLLTTNPGNCNANGMIWADLTSRNETFIESLRFSTRGSWCVNSSTGVRWQVTTDSATPACDPATAGYAAASGHSLLETRVIRIGISAVHALDNQIRFGRLDEDEDEAGAPTHVLDVKVRNNRLIDVI